MKLRALEPRILGLSFGDAETAIAIHETLAPLIEGLGRAGNQSMVRQWEATGARVDRQRAAIGQVIISIVAIIVLGIFLSLTLLRAMAERQRVGQFLSRERETAELYRGFVALVSHQFRTPLAVIDSAMQRVLRSGKAMPRSEIDRRASQVRAEIAGLTNLLDATLDVTGSVRNRRACRAGQSAPAGPNARPRHTREYRRQRSAICDHRSGSRRTDPDQSFIQCRKILPENRARIGQRDG